MDISCKYCGEPWDHDELHYGYLNGQSVPYKEMSQKFKKLGCNAFEDKDTPCDRGVVDEQAALHAGVAQDLFSYPEEWALE